MQAQVRLLGFDASLGEGFKPCGTLEKSHFHRAGRAIPLFANDDFRDSIERWIVGFVDFFPKDEGDDIGVLLDRARFPQVCQLRAMIT